MPRIAILGASGTGKTTLAEVVAARLGAPHFDSDAYYHLPTDPPYRVPREPEARRRLLEDDLAPHRSWVLSGGAMTWVPEPRIGVELVVFLRVPEEVRLERLVRREKARFGARIEPGGDMAEDHQGFLAWTRGYLDGTAEGTNTLPLHEAFLARTSAAVLRLEGTPTLEVAVERVLAAAHAGAPKRHENV